jgi:hypothetical protein
MRKLIGDERTLAAMLARHREALVATAVAGSISTLLVWLAPRGGDYAAHAYQRGLFLRHGFTFWDNYWYEGRYAFGGYSLLYYPLAAWLGIGLLAVLSVVVAAAAFAVLLEREWDERAVWASRTFAVLWPCVVLTGEFPFLLGMALAFLALVALQAGRQWLAAALVFAVVAASPVAFVLLAVAAAAVAARRGYRLVATCAFVVAAVVELALLRIFPAGGTLGFPWIEAGAAVVFCLGGIALTLGADDAAPVRRFLVVYLLVVLAVWAIPSGLGHDVARVRLLALPLVLLLAALRRWRPLPVVVVAVLLAAFWNIQPLASQWQASAADGSRAAKVWTAPVAWLHAHLGPGSRVEAIDTSQHWPAYYLAGEGIPLARGWFRQDDFPFNRLLYAPSLEHLEYLAWLHRIGIAYVVATRFPLDHTAVAEDELVTTTLPRVFRTPDVSIYRVPHAHSIASSGARVLALHQARVVLHVSRAGNYRIAIRWSRFSSSSNGVTYRTRDGMTGLHALRPGVVTISFAP